MINYFMKSQRTKPTDFTSQESPAQPQYIQEIERRLLDSTRKLQNTEDSLKYTREFNNRLQREILFSRKFIAQLLSTIKLLRHTPRKIIYALSTHEPFDFAQLDSRLAFLNGKQLQNYAGPSATTFFSKSPPLQSLQPRFNYLQEALRARFHDFESKSQYEASSTDWKSESTPGEQLSRQAMVDLSNFWLNQALNPKLRRVQTEIPRAPGSPDLSTHSPKSKNSSLNCKRPTLNEESLRSSSAGVLFATPKKLLRLNSHFLPCLNHPAITRQTSPNQDKPPASHISLQPLPPYVHPSSNCPSQQLKATDKHLRSIYTLTIRTYIAFFDFFSPVMVSIRQRQPHHYPLLKQRMRQHYTSLISDSLLYQHLTKPPPHDPVFTFNSLRTQYKHDLVCWESLFGFLSRFPPCALTVSHT